MAPFWYNTDTFNTVVSGRVAPDWACGAEKKKPSLTTTPTLVTPPDVKRADALQSELTLHLSPPVKNQRNVKYVLLACQT